MTMTKIEVKDSDGKILFSLEFNARVNYTWIPPGNIKFKDGPYHYNYCGFRLEQFIEGGPNGPAHL